MTVDIKKFRSKIEHYLTNNTLKIKGLDWATAEIGICWQNEFGMCEEFPILVRSSFDMIESLFRSCKEYGVSSPDYLNRVKFDRGLYFVSLAEPPSETHLLQTGSLDGLSEKVRKSLLLHITNQQKCNIEIVIEPKIYYPSDNLIREMVKETSLISTLLQTTNIPFCMPRSMGQAHPDDLSRIVYYS